MSPSNYMDDEKPTPPEDSEHNPVEPGKPAEPEKPAEPNEAAGKTDETTPLPKPVVMRTPSHKKLWAGIIIIIVLILAGLAWWYFGNRITKPDNTTQTTVSQTNKPSGTTKVQVLQLDPNKNYGNKYADGILPVGDGKYVTSGPKQGYVYACSQYAQNLAGKQGGASVRGPWFTNNNTEYDMNKKSHVQGKVYWHGLFTDTVSGNTRTITSNNLPLNDPTGTFPIASTDPAYQYDRNPNTIGTQNFVYSLNADPTYSANPNCEGGQVGVMLTGVALFNALDAGGRDAGAWEVQDSCDGHPQGDGIYHYHTLSACIKDISVHTVIGYALDGFPITGPDVSTNNVLTTSDLDECHGIVSSYTVNGKAVTGYHYVMTEDFPYSVSCFRGTPITPPGQQQDRQNGSLPNQNQQSKPGPPAKQ